jgi:acyl carrier protein
MMSAVEEVIENVIRAVSGRHKLALPLLRESMELEEDLGFTPWMVVELFASLEEVLGVDPLEQDGVMISEVRTVGDLCDIYEGCMAQVE